MDSTAFQYVIVGAISAVGTILSAVIAYRGRRKPSGDAELVDRQTYYTNVIADNHEMTKRIDVLEQQKDELRAIKEKLETANDLLSRQLDAANEQNKRLTEEVAVLKQQRDEHIKEIADLKNDVVDLTRKVNQLEKNGSGGRG